MVPYRARHRRCVYLYIGEGWWLAHWAKRVIICHGPFARLVGLMLSCSPSIDWAGVVVFPIGCMVYLGSWVRGWVGGGGWGAVRRSRENFLIFANFLGFYVLNRLVTREETPSPSLLY